MSWILERDALKRQIDGKKGSRTVYLHAGSSGRHSIDMKFVSQQLYIAYDIVKNQTRWFSPCFGCWYFEFDQHDSRRSGVKAMIVSFMCTYSCRFLEDEKPWYPRSPDSWSLKDLINVFLRVRATFSMRDITIVLGRLDQCDEDERSVLLQAILEQQNGNELVFKLLITTTRPEAFLCDLLPPGNIISLDDCPMSLDEYLYV